MPYEALKVLELVHGRLEYGDRARPVGRQNLADVVHRLGFRRCGGLRGFVHVVNVAQFGVAAVELRRIVAIGRRMEPGQLRACFASLGAEAGCVDVFHNVRHMISVGRHNANRFGRHIAASGSYMRPEATGRGTVVSQANVASVMVVNQKRVASSGRCDE